MTIESGYKTMEEITIQELLTLDTEKRFVIDIRNADNFQRGTVEGAVNIPMEELEQNLQRFTNADPVYVLCHTGEKSKEAVELLKEHGIHGVNIQGGYRAFLRYQLDCMMEKESYQERTKEIERSIIKKFRKPIWRKFTKAVNEYQCY